MFPSRVMIAEGVGQVIFWITEGRLLANAVMRHLEEKRGALPTNVCMSIRLEEESEGFTLCVTLEHKNGRPQAIASAVLDVLSFADTARWLWRKSGEREASLVGSQRP